MADMRELNLEQMEMATGDPAAGERAGSTTSAGRSSPAAGERNRQDSLVNGTMVDTVDDNLHFDDISRPELCQNPVHRQVQQSEGRLDRRFSIDRDEALSPIRRRKGLGPLRLPGSVRQLAQSAFPLPARGKERAQEKRYSSFSPVPGAVPAVSP